MDVVVVFILASGKPLKQEEIPVIPVNFSKLIF